MTATDLKKGRVKAGLTQAQAAARLGVSQGYVSLLENGERRVTSRLAAVAARIYSLPPTALPLPETPGPEPVDPDRFARQLSALGYPGYRHLRPGRASNPAQLVLDAISVDDVDVRLTTALPWVLTRYSNLDWGWLMAQAKLRNLQNRLGFLVTLARKVAERERDPSRVRVLTETERALFPARLVAETTLSRERMPEAEKEWLRTNRPDDAARWNVLSSMTVDQLSYAA
jgi:transcriptional regulator with XRE-family HTH domain